MTTTKIMTSQPQQPSQTVQMPSTIPLQVGGQFPLTLPIHGNVLGNFSLSGLPSQAINLQSGSVSVQALIQSLQQQVKQQQPPPQHSSSQLEPDSRFIFLLQHILLGLIVNSNMRMINNYITINV